MEVNIFLWSKYNAVFRKVKRISYFQFVISLLLAMIYTEFLKTNCDKYGGMLGANCGESEENEESRFFFDASGSRHNSCEDVIREQWILRGFVIPLLVEVALFEILLRVTCVQSLLAFFFITTAVISMTNRCEEVLVKNVVGMRDVSAISGLLTWLYIFSAAQMLPKFGTKIMIFVKVFKRLSKLIFAYMPMLLGFSLSFGLILPDNKSFGRPITRINNVVGMLLGELSLLDNFPNDEELEDSINDTTLNNTLLNNTVLNNTLSTNTTGDLLATGLRSWKTTEFTAHLLFFFFCICASIVVFNVLTAFAIKDVEEVLSKAHKSKLLKKAEYITYLEESFLGRCAYPSTKLVYSTIFFTVLLRYIDFCVETEIKITPGLDSKKRAGFSKRQVTKWIKEIKQKTIPTAD